MARRVVEEDTTDGPVVVDRDESWIGRTIVTLVVIALLVVAAIWLVNAVGDDEDGRSVNPGVNNEQNDGGTGGDGEGGTDGDGGTDPLPTPGG